VLDERGEAFPGTVVEIWQANAAGRYAHDAEDHAAPLDPKFVGVGRCLTASDGSYRFTTIRPGAYPWQNHPNAWRPGHIHFSVFGPSLTGRLVTQMYFPGDPLQAFDPIIQAVPEESRPRLIAQYDHEVTEEAWALGFRFDVVLAGEAATPADPDHA
jgi:protocatechuate 3,4-dioxygenase beta subunit